MIRQKNYENEILSALGHTGHFIGQTENPLKIIRIMKHFNFSHNKFSRH
jgi:ribonucleotide reductase beta subunit family protein with ferritin-like domain